VHRFGEELPGRLVEGLLAAIHALVTDEEAAARLPWS
jgi:hypothetical protein